VRSLPGRGAEGIVDGSMVRVGSHRMFEEMKLCPHENGCPISEIEKEGYTSVCISHGDRMIGYITLADSLRDESREAVARLHDLGIRTMMISGDNAAIAEVIGREVGIDEVRGQLMPADKLAILETRKADGERVMMIGDGINDAPALAAAEVGVAMGAVGTDVALETADVALMSDDVGKVPFTIAHARRTMALIRENIGISIGVKLLFVVLATFGWATLWMAVLADTGLSLLVTSNSLRLLKTRNV
jgi:Zn2+/Cd2+-exporting ATPase